MGKLFYPKLAAQNIRKNAQTYVPYLITCICAVTMYYIVYALSVDPSAGGTVSQFLKMGTVIMAIFAVCFLFYTNSFLLKRRKKEFGLMSILGMEKRHIARIVSLETLYVFVLSMVLGLGLGLLFFKLAHLILLSLLQFDFRFGFFISWQAMSSAVLLFTCIFALLLLYSLWQVGRARPIELIQGGQTGEREPKARWLLALLGLAALGGGYWISVTTKEPITVIFLFLVAVVLVIIGTYLLFITGGVTLLKLLRRNKGYYYQANHFISVSGMMYRMKQNAAGLATICILATMVLVMISSSASLYFGMEDALRGRYPRELSYTIYEADEKTVQKVKETVETVLQSEGLDPLERLSSRIMPLFGHLEGDELIVDGIYDANKAMLDLNIVMQEDYNQSTTAPIDLQEGEALLLTADQPFGRETLRLLDHTLQIRETQGQFEPAQLRYGNSNLSTTYTLVVRDAAVINDIQAACQALEYGPSVTLRYYAGFDLDATDQKQLAAARAISTALDEAGINHHSELRAANRSGFLEIYGGLFFLGLFLGFVFLLATVLIIYYKQIAEGYDDQGRYAIMQKVGLSRREARRAINSQILTMFFLPLLVACVHILFAFPAVTRMLYVLELSNSKIFVIATVVSLLVFALFYLAVYQLTAKVYYRLVDSGKK